MRSIWFVPALVLLAWSGVSPAQASVVGSGPAHALLGAEAVERDIILVKKNKKARKRLGWRKKMWKSRAHARRHIVPRTSGRQIIVVVPVVPEMVSPLDPPPRFSLGDTYSRRALQPLPQPYSYDPPVQPYGHEPEMAAIPNGLSEGERIGCNEAIGIVHDFGFSDVESRRCSGAIYQFSAIRDGQEYVISLRAEDGELTRVERQ